MRATAVSQEFFSIRICLTSTRRFIRKSSIADCSRRDWPSGDSRRQGKLPGPPEFLTGLQ
jgi:hypothetical protein